VPLLSKSLPLWTVTKNVQIKKKREKYNFFVDHNKTNSSDDFNFVTNISFRQQFLGASQDTE